MRMRRSLSVLYLGACISGIGAGAVYATCVGNAVKWFPDRRGLAVGLTAAGFGAGAALTVVPIRAVIAAHGYEAAFFWFGLVQGAIVFVLAWLLRAPAPAELPSTAPVRVIQTTRSYAPQEMLRSPVFWLLYVMFVLVSASGLMATAQIALIASDYNVANTSLVLGRHHADRRVASRQYRQRRGAPAIRLDIRSHRPRIHDGDRVRPGRG